METTNLNPDTNTKQLVSFETMPAVIGQILAEIKGLKMMLASPLEQAPLTKYVDINGAAEITSKSPNALRVQISLGNLKAIKKGSRNYFEREYLEKWLSGELTEEGGTK